MVSASSNIHYLDDDQHLGKSASTRPSIYPPIGVSFLNLSLDDPIPPSPKRSARLRKTRPTPAGKNRSSAPAAFSATAGMWERSTVVPSETESHDVWPTSNSLSSFASMSAASLAINSTESLPCSPVYDPAPPITPAYLRYMRAEMKRSDDHCFGSVACRHMDISREARWQARMLDLQKRLGEIERERSALDGRKWSLDLVDIADF